MGGASPNLRPVGGPTEAAIRCAENIALLRILHNIPQKRLKNSPSSLAFRNEEYNLPFDREHHLTGVLAFLSCLKDDPCRIPAVSVRECQEGSSMKLDVLVAVNRKNTGDGKHALRKIVEGFEPIFSHLRYIGQGE